MNSVKMTLLSMSSHSSERPPGVREVMGSIPVGTQIFVCPMLTSCRLIHLSQIVNLSRSVILVVSSYYFRQ